MQFLVAFSVLASLSFGQLITTDAAAFFVVDTLIGADTWANFTQACVPFLEMTAATFRSAGHKFEIGIGRFDTFDGTCFQVVQPLTEDLTSLAAFTPGYTNERPLTDTTTIPNHSHIPAVMSAAANMPQSASTNRVVAVISNYVPEFGSGTSGADVCTPPTYNKALPSVTSYDQIMSASNTGVIFHTVSQYESRWKDAIGAGRRALSSSTWTKRQFSGETPSRVSGLCSTYLMSVLSTGIYVD